jgi:PTS system nitrogen regulatory IIA component
MKLTDVITPDAVLVGLRAGTKAQLLGELARLAARRTKLPPAAILAALLAREKLGSTGLGRGFALPHARVEGLDRLLGLLVRLDRPIDYEAIDGSLVDVVCLLLIPAGHDSEHVATLAAIARAMRQEGVLAAVRQARDAGEIYGRVNSIAV